jgi:hypothetical protein
MIRYRLQCPDEHTFDAWFANSAAFDTQASRGLVACVVCGSTKIVKALMAPNVGTKGNRRTEVPAKAATTSANPDAAAAQGPALTGATLRGASSSGDDANKVAVARELAALLRRDVFNKLLAEVEAKAEYVGPDFAEEARKIHYDEAPSRGIYGEASPDDVAALIDEGIPVMPLPTRRKDGH